MLIGSEVYAIDSCRKSLHRFNCRGFTYLGLLIFIAIAGVGLAATGMAWQYKIKSEKELQLLFVGNQIQNAITRYYEASPSGVKVYPLTLEDLLLDKRFPTVKRYLRKIYPDPMTGEPLWGVCKTAGRVVGVYSLSKQKPFKIAGFEEINQNFLGAKTYQDWVFGQDTRSNNPSKNP